MVLTPKLKNAIKAVMDFTEDQMEDVLGKDREYPENVPYKAELDAAITLIRKTLKIKP